MKRVSLPAAGFLILLAWLVYTILQTLSVVGRVPELPYAIMAFLPGILGVVTLKAAGLGWDQLFLKAVPISPRGFIVLAVIFVVALAVVLPFGQWQGWDWMAALVYAPSSGIAQELFFRSVLLPVVLLVLRDRPRLALVTHSIFFALWHIGPLFIGAPLWAVLAVMFVPFVCGIGWGWQVKQDGTVFWAMLQHSLIWVIGLQFPMPG